MKQSVAAAVVIGALTLTPWTAGAQSTVTDIVNFLVTNQTIPTEDAGSDRAAAEAARDTITRALIVNLTSVPIATSSSGFLYRLNPELGTVERATETFGGFFVERAFSPGHGRASFGMSASTSSFDKLDGQPLRDGTLVTTGSRFPDEAAPFETESLTLRVSSSTMTAYASVGITDRFELARRAAVREAEHRRATRQRLSRRDVPAGQRIGDRVRRRRCRGAREIHVRERPRRRRGDCGRGSPADRR